MSAACGLSGRSKERLVTGGGVDATADELVGTAAALACSAARPNTGCGGPTAVAGCFSWEKQVSLTLCTTFSEHGEILEQILTLGGPYKTGKMWAACPMNWLV